MDKDQWIRAFIQQLAVLGARASPTRLASLAESSHELFGRMDPTKVAQIEFDIWPADEGNFPDTQP
jgi:hypothetical protein